MSISVSCQCGKSYTLPENMAGSKAKCAACGQVFIITAPDAARLDIPSPSFAAANALAGGTTVPGSNASAKAKAATDDAWRAVKMLLRDPAGGQSASLKLLGDGRALGVGMIFIAAMALTACLAARAALSQLGHISAAFGTTSGLPFDPASLDMTGYLKIILMALIPAAAILISLIALGRIFGGKASFRSSVFCTGVIVLPVGFLLASTGILGLGNAELMLLIAIFAATIGVVLTYSALVAHELSTAKAVWLTPAVLVLTIYISKVIYFSAVLRP